MTWSGCSTPRPMPETLFVLLSMLALGSAVYVVTARNPVYAVIGLMAFFLAISGMYVLLKAPFLAAVQVIVYVGAILVLFLFVIMLFDLRELESEGWRLSGMTLGVTALLVSLMGGLAIVPVLRAVKSVDSGWGRISSDFGSTKSLAMLAYQQYPLPIELISLLLLAAIIGAVALAKRRFDSGEETT